MTCMRSTAAAIAVAALVAGCESVPTGPSLMVLPGQGKSFEQFQADDAACRLWAAGRSPQQAPSGSAVGGAAVGTASGGSGDRRRRRKPGGRRSRRSGRRFGRRDRHGRKCWRGRAHAVAAPLRHDVRPMHVREGQSGAGSSGDPVLPGAAFAPPGGSASACGRSAATASRGAALAGGTVEEPPRLERSAQPGLT
jgi:hypothetical protein